MAVARAFDRQYDTGMDGYYCFACSLGIARSAKTADNFDNFAVPSLIGLERCVLTQVGPRLQTY